MTKDYAPSLTFTIYLDAFLTTAVPPETAMSDLQKQLEDIKAQLAIVTNILPVVNELKEAYDSFNENQENSPTSQDDESIPEELLTNIVTASPAAHSPPSPRSVQPSGPQPSTSTATPPVPMAVALEDTSPTVTPTNAQPPAGIATLQQIAGVTKNDQATIDGAVASTIATVLTNGLDVESRAKLDGTMA